MKLRVYLLEWYCFFFNYGSPKVTLSDGKHERNPSVVAIIINANAGNVAWRSTLWRLIEMFLHH